MSLLRTIRPLEQATIRSRVGRTSQPFTTVAFTALVRAGAGSRPYRRRHALGESELLASHRSLLCEDALPVVPQPIEQGPGHSAVPFGDGRPFS